MKINNKIIAGIFTFAIITLIIFAGPAKAFILGLVIEGDSQVEQGKKILFTATLDIQSVDKYLPVQELRLVINGPETRTCKFDITGKKIGNDTESGCHGINIKKTPLPQIDKGYGHGYGYDNSYGYGYGYDFGYGDGYNEQTLSYEITIHTQHFQIGNYESQLKALIGNKIFESKDKPTFTINKVSKTSYSSKSKKKNIIGDFCGNGFCDFGETTATCSQDCPLEPILLTFENKEDKEEENNQTQETQGQEENPKTAFSKITGAVTNTLGETGTWMAGIFILMIIGILGIVKFRKKK